MITQIDEGLWIKNSYFTAMGCKGSTRMVLVRTDDGILIYSPVDLDDDDVAAIGKLGAVVAIIAPNTMHHMYFTACHLRFPDAKCWIADGVAAKVQGLPRHETLRAGCAVAPAYELATIVTDGHKINETMLFHHPSGTLITADLLYNYQVQQYAGEKLFFRMIGCYGKPSVPFYHRMSIKDREGLAASMASVFKLPIRRIIMAHGEIVEGENMAQVFAQAWGNLLK